MVSSINFKKIYRNNINNMSCMFDGCIFLKKKLKFNSFNSDNVIDMSGMFSYCYDLEKINLSKFITEKVTNLK